MVYKDNPNYCMGRTLAFEFSYDDMFVKVITVNHGGFWVQKYISLSGDEAQPILAILKNRRNSWGGNITPSK